MKLEIRTNPTNPTMPMDNQYNQLWLYKTVSTNTQLLQKKNQSLNV